MSEEYSYPPEIERARLRLEAARERSGKERYELMWDIEGLGVPAYYDLEGHDSDMDGWKVDNLRKVCLKLNIRLSDLFTDELLTDADRITSVELVSHIKAYLEQHQMPLDEFEHKVGFYIGECLDNPPLLYQWCLDCLRSVGDEIGVDWKRALP